MKGKTKAILAIIATVAVVSVAAVGTATFLKDSGEASAAEEPNITNTLPIAGRDNDNPTDEQTTPNESEQTGTEEQGTESVENPAQQSANTNNQNQGTARPSSTGTTTNQAEPETTTITQERIASQETTLNWSNISLNSTISNKNINYTELNYKVEYYYDGELDEAKTDNLRAKYNEVIHECDDKVIPGYVFENVENLPLTITENEAANVIKVYYVKRTDLSYTVNYLEEGTNNVLAEAKVVENQTYQAEVTETAIDIPGYNKVEPTEATITIDVEGNVINFYYTKRTDLSYTVNYLEEGTNKVLAEAKTVGNQTFGDVITASINGEADETPEAIAGYNVVSVDKESLSIGVENNVINFYYTKRTDLSYTVNYLEQGTNTVLATAKTVNNQTFGATITASIEVANVTETPVAVAGYNVVSVDKESLSIGVENNVINFYYTKRTDLSYTVNYLEEGTNKVLATAKTVGNQTFEAVITASINGEADETPVAVTGYNVVSVDKESLTIGVEGNVINFYYAKNTYEYRVEHYYERLDGTFGDPDESKTDSGLKAEYQAIISTYTAKTENGKYTVSHVTPALESDNKVANLQIGVNEEENVIKVYYLRNSFDYKVEYYKDSVNGAKLGSTEVAQEKLGTVMNEELVTQDFGGNWINKYKPEAGYKNGEVVAYITITENNNDNIIKVVYKKDTFKYTVEYYYNEVLDGEATEEFTAEYLSEISEYPAKPKEGYVFEHVDTKDSDGVLPLVVTEVVANNVIRVYYAKPEINIEKTGPATAFVGDEITYTITLTNTGKIAGTAEVTDTLPTGLTFKSADNGGVFENGTVTWSNINVPRNNGKVELHLTAKVNANMIGKNIVNTAKVISNGKTDTAETAISEITPTIKEITQGETGKDSVNIILVMDLSYSMQSSTVANGTTTRLAAAKSAAVQFIDKLYQNGENSDATVTVLTFNTKDPLTTTKYVGDEVCDGGFLHNHYFSGCREINGVWYSEYHSEEETVPYSGTSQLGTTANSTNYGTLKTAINNITLPATNPGSGLGTHIGAALDLTETTIQTLETTSPYSNNKNVVIFLSDGAPDPTNNSNNATYISNKAAAIIAEPAEFYPIGFGTEAGTSGTSAYNILKSMSSENPKKVYTSNSVEGLVSNFVNILEQTQDKNPTSSVGVVSSTLANDLVVNSENPITGTYNDVVIFTCTSISEIGNYCITYDSTTKKLTFDINAWNSVPGHTQITSNNFVLTYYIAR